MGSLFRSCDVIRALFGLWWALVAAATSPPATSGQGASARESSPNFVWNPPSSAPLPDPVLAGNSTVLFLRVKDSSSSGCGVWYPPVEDFLLSRIAQNRFLSIAAPGCGHTVSADGTLSPPTQSASLATLERITRTMHSLSVDVTPVVVVRDPTVAATLVRSTAAAEKLAAALTKEADSFHYAGFVLSLNLSSIGSSGDDDDTKLAALLIACSTALTNSPDASASERQSRTISIELNRVRKDDALARAIAAASPAASVIVRVVASTSAPEFMSFEQSAADAVSQFGGHGVPFSIGLSLRADSWWGGSGRPSIVDVVERRDALGNLNIKQVTLDVGWSDASFVADQSRLDLYQLALLAPYRGGVGMPWETLPPPVDGKAATRDTWGAGLATWRTAQRKRLGFDGGGTNTTVLPYDVAELAWTRSNFVSPQVMLHDRFLFDRSTGNWTVKRWLDDVTMRWGPVDSVLLWQSYPNIGVDDRSQFEMAYSLPGGVANTRALVDAFHEHNVKVLLPYNPWDTGTMQAAGYTGDAAELTKLIEAVGADGFNGDTMFGLDVDFYAPSVADRRPIALQPECSADRRDLLAKNGTRMPQDYEGGITLPWNPLTWNYWGILPPGKYPSSNSSSTGVIDASVPMSSNIAGLGPPLVSRYRALESRHMAQICERWAVERTDGLQHAFINGMGYVPWESIWGIWNPLSQGDGEALRRTMHVFRYFNTDITGSNDAFEPLIAAPTTPGVFCSRFNQKVYACVNRRGSETPANDAMATRRLVNDTTTLAGIPCPPSGSTYWDIWRGIPVASAPSSSSSSGCSVTLSVAPREFTALALLTAAETSASALGWSAYIAERRAFAETPLSTLSYATAPLAQAVVPPLEPQLKKLTTTSEVDTTNMTNVPATLGWHFAVHGVEVEGFGGLAGPAPMSLPDVQMPWETLPQRKHVNDALDIPGFLIDTFPVTNARYSIFITRTRYAPRDTMNFLRHWSREERGPPTPSHGSEEEPVRWVSSDDARAFCAAEGKRLPHTWEWQRAAQGAGGTRAYPWGDSWDDTAVPPRVRTSAMGSPPNVGTHPRGAAKEEEEEDGGGVQDCVATIWQMSDSYCDAHTCRIVLRGGSTYAPIGSAWYFPAALRLDEQNTLLQLSDSMDRSGGIGFRCAVDAPL